MTIGHTTSRNLIDWSPIEYVLPMDKRFNWSSPGNIVKDGDERVHCFQKYPTPGATPMPGKGRSQTIARRPDTRS